jgi:hypothetical protein
MLFSSAVSADWFYDTVEAIDDAGIAVSGVIVDGESLCCGKTNKTYWLHY